MNMMEQVTDMELSNRIAIVSQECAIRQALADVLAGHDMECVCVNDISSLHRELMLDRGVFHLVVLDLDTDVVSGPYFSTDIQSLASQVPVIGITGQPYSVFLGKETCLVGCLLKPFEMTDLMALIARATNVNKLKHQLNPIETLYAWN